MRTARTHARKEGTGSAPSATDSQIDKTRILSQFFTPLSDCFSHTFESYKSVGPTITSLLLFGRPTNISDFVMSIYVLTIQSMFQRGTDSNVGKELSKGREPKFNTTTTVMSEGIIIRILTTIFSVRVSSVFRASTVMACCPVRGLLCDRNLSMQTSARSRVTAQQARTGNPFNRSADAFTKPILSVSGRWGKTENRPSPAFNASQIFESRIGWKWLKNDAIFRVGHLIKVNSFNGVIRNVERLQHFLRSASILTQMEAV